MVHFTCKLGNEMRKMKCLSCHERGRKKCPTIVIRGILHLSNFEKLPTVQLSIFMEIVFITQVNGLFTAMSNFLGSFSSPRLLMLLNCIYFSDFYFACLTPIQTITKKRACADALIKLQHSQGKETKRS